jgi:hypothetical protein
MRKLLSAAAAACVFAVAGPATAQATTGGGPSVTFSFTQTTVTSGTSPEVRWATRDLPIGSGVFLQLWFPPTRNWVYWKTLTGAPGTGTIPAMPPGVWHFRARALQAGNIVAISAAKALSVTTASSSGGVLPLLGGIGGAVVSWLLEHLSLAGRWLLRIFGRVPVPD